MTGALKGDGKKMSLRKRAYGTCCRPTSLRKKKYLMHCFKSFYKQRVLTGHTNKLHTQLHKLCKEPLQKRKSLQRSFGSTAFPKKLQQYCSPSHGQCSSSLCVLLNHHSMISFKLVGPHFKLILNGSR